MGIMIFLGLSQPAAYTTSIPALGLSCRLLALHRLSETLRRNFGVSALKNFALIHPKLASVIAIRLQVSPEACILGLDSVLADVRQAE